MTTKGSRLKASSGSGYWYVLTTDTASFLGAAESKMSVELVTPPLPPPPCLLPTICLSPVDKQIHLLVLVTSKWLAAHKAVLVLRHSMEREHQALGQGTEASL